MDAQIQPKAEKKRFSITAFDIVVGLLWFALFFLTFPLPNNGTATVLKSGGIILWAIVLFLYLGFLLYKSKKSIFFSGLKNNLFMLGILATLIVSTALALFPADALWGNDFNMSSSSVILMVGAVAFFVIKIISVSADKSIVRFLQQMPIWLLLSDVVSAILYAIPHSLFESMFGNYAEYLTFLKTSPYVLHGNPLNSLAFHVLAIIVLAWMVSLYMTKRSDKDKQVGTVSQWILLVALSIFGSLSLPTSGNMIMYLVGIVVLFLLFWSFIAIRDKDQKTQIFLAAMLASFVVMVVARFVFFQLSIATTNLYLSMPIGTSIEIIQASFMNRATPIWRLLVGWGGSAVSYLFPLYRPLEIVKALGSDVLFYRTSNFWFDILVEYGLLGILVWGGLIANAVYMFFKSKKSSELYVEFSLFTVLLLFSFVTFFSPFMILLWIVVLALYFDKVEMQQDNLKEIRAVSLHITDYKSNVENIIVHVVLGASIIFAIVGTWILGQGAMTHYYLLRASKRVSIAQEYIRLGDYEKASNTLVSAYSESVKGTTVCNKCAPFFNLRLNSLYSLYLLNNSYPDKVGASTIDKRFLANRLINHAYALVDENPLRGDYWLSAAGVFSAMSETQKSGPYADEALLSFTAALNQNPYNVTARYDFIDFLVRLGDDPQSIQLIGQNLEILKSTIGSPLRVRFIEAGYAIKLRQFDQAIKAYEDIKASVESSTLGAVEKEELLRFTNEQIEQVKKIKEQATTQQPSAAPAPSPSATPSVTPTPTPSVTD